MKLLKSETRKLFMRVFVDFEQRWRTVLEEAEGGGVQRLEDLRIKFQRIHSVRTVLPVLLYFHFTRYGFCFR